MPHLLPMGHQAWAAFFDGFRAGYQAHQTGLPRNPNTDGMMGLGYPFYHGYSVGFALFNAATPLETPEAEREAARAAFKAYTVRAANQDDVVKRRSKRLRDLGLIENGDEADATNAGLDNQARFKEL